MKPDFFKNIKVVGFDFDDTLVDEQYSIKNRWKKTLKEYYFLSSKIEETFFKIYKQKGPLYRFHLNDTLRKLKIDSKNVKKILSKFLTTRDKELLQDGSFELLDLLKSKNIAVGIITDGKQSYQKERIKKAGIYKFMDFIYYGNGKKEKKPNKKVLKELFKSLKIRSPERFLYIGNDFINDIQGMSSVGVRVCWVTKEKFMPKIHRAIKAKNLKELLKYFK